MIFNWFTIKKKKSEMNFNLVKTFVVFIDIVVCTDVCLFVPVELLMS